MNPPSSVSPAGPGPEELAGIPAPADRCEDPTSPPWRHAITPMAADEVEEGLTAEALAGTPVLIEGLEDTTIRPRRRAVPAPSQKPRADDPSVPGDERVASSR
jgi:hypothetical protein